MYEVVTWFRVENVRDSRETSVLRKDHLKLLRRRILANTSYRSRSKSTMLAREETGGPRSLIEKSLFIPFIPFYLFGGHRREGNFDNWRWSNKPNRNWNRSSVACIDSVTYPFPSLSAQSWTVDDLIWDLGNHLFETSARSLSPLRFFWFLSLSLFLCSLSRDTIHSLAFDTNAPNGRAQLTFVSALTKWKVEELEN